MKKKFDELSPYKLVHHDWHRSYPVHIEIDPTAFCNQDCLRCSYKQEIDGARDYIIQHQKSQLPPERFLELIEEFSSLGVRALTFSGGGEPLCYPHIDEVVRATLSAGIKFGIITNLALNINAELLSQAVWIRVSLDAGSAETYNLLHRPGNTGAFDLALNNIQQLTSLNSELDLGVNYIVQPENFGEMFQAAQQVKALGARYIRFVPAIATNAIDYSQYWDEISTQQDRSTQLIDAKFHVFIIKERFQALAAKHKNYSFCRKQQIHPLIGADGQLYPCCLLKYYPQHALGSIHGHTFKEVWDGEQRRHWLDHLDVDQCPPCWFDQTNEFLEYLYTENPKHVDFV